MRCASTWTSSTPAATTTSATSSRRTPSSSPRTGDTLRGRQSIRAFYAAGLRKIALGLLINPQPAPDMRAAGSGAWAGLFNTHFWVDHATGITGAIYMQFLPFFDPKANQLYADFEKAAYAG